MSLINIFHMLFYSNIPLLNDETFFINSRCIIFDTFVRPLGYHHDQTAEKSFAHNLLHAFCCLIDSSYFGSELARKRYFSIIVKMSTFRLWYTCILAAKALIIF